MKKFISTLWAICLMLSLLIPSATASTSETISGANISTISINEYDLLSKMAEESTSSLLAKGYSLNEIDTIQNLDSEYRAHLEQFTDMETEALKNLGYSDEQILILRNFSGSQREIQALAAGCNLSLYCDYATWSDTKNRTDSRLRYSFNWTGVPLIKTTDIVSVRWNDWTIHSHSANVTYAPISGTGSNIIANATYVPNNGPLAYGSSFRFAMTRNDNSYWGKSGTGFFNLYHNYYKKDMSAYAEYGHSTIICTPSASIPISGEFSFTYGTDRADQAWAVKECS